MLQALWGRVQQRSSRRRFRPQSLRKRPWRPIRHPLNLSSPEFPERQPLRRRNLRRVQRLRRHRQQIQKFRVRRPLRRNPRWPQVPLRRPLPPRKTSPLPVRHPRLRHLGRHRGRSRVQLRRHLLRRLSTLMRSLRRHLEGRSPPRPQARHQLHLPRPTASQPLVRQMRRPLLERNRRRLRLQLHPHLPRPI